MRRRDLLRLVAGLGLSANSGIASAADYKPVQCRAALDYRGAAMHAAVTPPTAIGELGGAFDTMTVARFEQAMATARQATSAPSLTAAVAVPGRGMWSTDVGLSPTAPLHYWASTGKAFIAVTVLQLIEEGKLALDQSVSRWIAAVPNGDAVTVRHLLDHTSGLFSANEDLKAHADPRYRDPAEALKIAARHGAMFCPGALWRYSNTGYDLLGEIIAKVDGRPYPEAITARIIAPLGLRRLRALTPNRPAGDVAPLHSTKETPIDPSWPGAAGPIAGVAEDMIRFWHALFAGRLLKPPTVRLMFERLYPMFDPGTYYGLGVMALEVPEPGGASTLWLGHAGGTPGAGAMAVYSPRNDAFVAVALTGDGSAAATANLLLRQLQPA